MLKREKYNTEPLIHRVPEVVVTDGQVGVGVEFVDHQLPKDIPVEFGRRAVGEKKGFSAGLRAVFEQFKA